MQAQVVQLELANVQLVIKLKQQETSEAPEGEKTAEQNDKQKIRELIFSERPHRSTDAHLPENKSALTFSARKQVAAEKTAFRSKQDKERRQRKQEGPPVSTLDPYIHTFKLTNSTV